MEAAENNAVPASAHAAMQKTAATKKDTAIQLLSTVSQTAASLTSAFAAHPHLRRPCQLNMPRSNRACLHHGWKPCNGFRMLYLTLRIEVSESSQVHSSQLLGLRAWAALINHCNIRMNKLLRQQSLAHHALSVFSGLTPSKEGFPEQRYLSAEACAPTGIVLSSPLCTSW